ncbi:MAG: threonine/serine exporter family protein [Treponemataceae bacterium]
MTEDALSLAADAGRLILEAGGETYRAEEIVVSLCVSWDFRDAECFATPTGLMASVTDGGALSRATVRRVARRSVDLHRVSRLVEITARERVCREGPLQFRKALDSVRDEKSYGPVVSFIAAGASVAFFTLLFGGSLGDSCAAFLVGVGIKAIQFAGSSRRFPDFIINSVGGAATAALSAAAVYLGLAQNLDKTVIGSIMLLVPGLSTVNAIRDTIAGDLVAGVARLADAFMAAAAISLGAGFAFSIASFVQKAFL